MKKWPNGWIITQIWTCRKCQDTRWFVIIKGGASHNASTYVFFLFLILFVVCKLWILACILHSLDDVWLWSTYFSHVFLDIWLWNGSVGGDIGSELLVMESQVPRLEPKQCFKMCFECFLNLLMWCCVVFE